MHVDIVTKGDELLIGQVVDTNSAWMGQELNKNGFTVHRITSISDSRQEILDALTETTKRSRIVLLTGGLGPTRDDITKAPLNTWRSHANLLYSNWLNYFVYQTTPFDLGEIK